jgi:hypothetical protein
MLTHRVARALSVYQHHCSQLKVVLLADSRSQTLVVVAGDGSAPQGVARQPRGAPRSSKRLGAW